MVSISKTTTAHHEVNRGMLIYVLEKGLFLFLKYSENRSRDAARHYAVDRDSWG